MRISFLLILSLLFLHACNLTTGPDPEPNSTSVEGYIFDTFDNGTLPVTDATMHINGTTYKSDEEGEFKLTEVPTGEHEVTFSSEYHHTLDTVLTFEYNEDRPDIFEIELAPILLDILPLEIGNTWVYQVESERIRYNASCIENCTASQFEIGTESVEVIEMNENESSFIYTIEETIEGYYVNEENDTTFFNEQGSYLITEDKETSSIETDLTNAVSFNLFHYLPGPLFDGYIIIQETESEWGHYSSLRYIPYSRIEDEQSILLDSPYSIAIDTGTVYFNFEYSGNNGSGYNKKELISFEEN